MTKIKIIFTVLIMTLTVSLTNAQNKPPPSPANDFVENDAPQRTDNLAEQLGLSQEQRIQIREMRQQLRPQLQQAQRRFNQTKEELDVLIYSDSLDETTLQTKLRSVVEAQAEITRIRAMSELAVRKVLTPEQLVMFRNLRQRFKQQQRDRQIQRQRRQRIQRMNQNRRDRNPSDRPIQNRQRQL